MVIYCFWHCLLGCSWNRRRCFVGSKSESEKNVPGNNSCATDSGRDSSEMGISACQVRVLPLLHSVAPLCQNLSLCVFLPPPHLVCWRKDFFWEIFLLGKTNPGESEIGLCSEWGAELKPGEVFTQFLFHHGQWGPSKSYFICLVHVSCQAVKINSWKAVRHLDVMVAEG